MTEEGDAAGDAEMSSNSKVGRLIQRYDVPEIGDELERRWTADADDRMSLRELADHFNRTLLERALQRNATSTVDGEVANLYRLLTEDDVSSGQRVQAENRLEQNGVDVEQLRNDFVSRQAIHTYLTKERDATYDRPAVSDEERIETRMDTIGRLKNRLVTVTEQVISELAQSGQLASGETSVTVLVQVQCATCNTQYSIRQFLTNGGCDCRPDGE